MSTHAFTIPITRGTIAQATTLDVSTMDLVPAIAQVVQRAFGVTLDDIKGRDRHRKYAWPRQVAMFFIRELSTDTLVECGSWFGKHQSAVRHGWVTVKNRMETCHRSRDLIERLRVEIGRVR